MTTTLTPPADAPLPYSVDGGWNGAVRDATGRLLMRGWYRVNLPALKHLVACANAAPALVSRADALATECDVLIDGIRTLESARDTALARVAELEAQLAKQAPVIEAARDVVAALVAHMTNGTPAHDVDEAAEEMRRVLGAFDKPAGCQNNSPAGHSGHWREWHRGHGCEKDPSNTTTKETP